MKLSIIIICWNDLKILPDCLRSIFDQISLTDTEIIISDNGSTDGSTEWVRTHFPEVRIVENNANLGYARGNNAGIAATKDSDYVLILNPDTILHDDCLPQWLRFADTHPEAGAFGCRVDNPNGSLQYPAHPFPSNWRDLKIAFRISKPYTYRGWQGETEREIDWQSGCCLLVRRPLLQEIGGFDERFFYHYEEVDLCLRIWKAGWKILYTPAASITHIGGQSVNQAPIRFELETYRGRYRYFYKHHGAASTRRARLIALLSLHMSQLGCALQRMWQPREQKKDRLEFYRTLIRWNRYIDPVEFNLTGKEPDVGYSPLAPAPLIHAD